MGMSGSWIRMVTVGDLFFSFLENRHDSIHALEPWPMGQIQLCFVQMIHQIEYYLMWLSVKIGFIFKFIFQTSFNTA